MSGTILVSKNVSYDVRTVDFVRITDILRSFATRSKTATKLLETVDEFGMNMICADELSSEEFKDFSQIMREILSVVRNEDKGLADFLEKVCSGINKDERTAH